MLQLLPEAEAPRPRFNHRKRLVAVGVGVALLLLGMSVLCFNIVFKSEKPSRPPLRIIDDPHPDPEEEFSFGTVVDLDGDLLLAGDPGYSEAHGGSGAAFLFDFKTGALLHTFRSPEPSQGVGFGGTVAIAGDHVVIGPTRLRPERGQPGKGRIYQFDARSRAFIRAYGPTIEDQRSGKASGYSFASLSGDALVLLAGMGGMADGSPTPETSDTHLQIYDLVSGELRRKIPIADPSMVDVASAGKVVVVLTQNACRFYDTETGSFLNKIDMPPLGSSSPWTVRYSGQKVLVASCYNPKITVYDPKKGKRLFDLKLLSDSFGQHMEITGNRIVVLDEIWHYLKAPTFDLDTFSLPPHGGIEGIVHIYDARKGRLIETIKDPALGSGNRFTGAVALSGNNMVIGSMAEPHAYQDRPKPMGKLYLYSLSESSGN